MNFAYARGVCGWLLLVFLMVVMASFANAQGRADPADWKESEVPPPPAFDLGKLVTFDVSVDSPLVYGVDPSTITISKNDSLVRYVMVAKSASGASNIMYEALRCATGEFKTYARYSPAGVWVQVKDPEWKSVFDSYQSRHVLRFARQGACDALAPPLTVEEMVRSLRNSAKIQR